jgi:hypothetical protein
VAHGSGVVDLAMEVKTMVSLNVQTQFDLQAQIDAEITDGGIGGIVDVPRGEIEVTETINVQQVRGLVIRGQGAVATELVWAGPPDVPMFWFNRTQGCFIERVSIRPGSRNPLLEGVRIEQGALDDSNPKHAQGLDSSLMTVRDVIFRGQARLGTAIRVYLNKDGANQKNDHDVEPDKEVGDKKNDHHRFERLQISGCTYAGLVLEGRNAKALHLDQVVMMGTVKGVEVCQYGVLTVANKSPISMRADGTPGPIGDPDVNGGKPVFNKGASFTAIGGQMAGNREANVYIGARNDELVLQGIYSEKSARWLVVPDYKAEGSVGAFPVKMVGCRYTVNPNTPEDGIIVVFCADGPLEIDTCSFGQRQEGEQLRICYNPKVPPGTFSMRNSAISNDGDGNVFVCEAPSNQDYQVVNRGYRHNRLGQLGVAKVDMPGQSPAHKLCEPADL